jgi:hypothetical protein
VENIDSQVDVDGYRHLIFQEIMDHKKDHTAILMDDKWIQHGANKSLRKTTQGWFLQVSWRDGTTSWESLQNLKESNPVEVAHYAIANKIAEETAFAWWIPYTLKHQERIIKASKTMKHKKQTKFGLEIPPSPQRAYEIDKETGTTFWTKAIEKEMFHVRPVFDILESFTPNSIQMDTMPSHI